MFLSVLSYAYTFGTSDVEYTKLFFVKVAGLQKVVTMTSSSVSKPPLLNLEVA